MKKKRKSRKKIIIFSVIIIVLFAFVLLRKNANKAAAGFVLVKTAIAEKETLITSVLADGNILAEEEKAIKAALAGIVKDVYVKSGDLVLEGDKIYSIEKSVYEDSLEKARLSLKEARANRENMMETYKNQQRINALKMEEAEKNLEIALLSYEQQKTELEERKSKMEEELEEIKRNLEKAESRLRDSEYLYEKNAISQNTLKEAEELYDELSRKYTSLKTDLGLFIEKTMPNALELAQLKIDNARNQLDYLKASLAFDSISEKDLELAELRVINLEREVERLQNDLTKAVTYAPMAGTLINIDIKTGDSVLEGATVGKIADLSSYIAEVFVDEIDINKIKTGQEVKITSDSFAEELEGVVEFIAPGGTLLGNITKYRTEVRIKDDMGVVRPGMFVNAEIITNIREDVITVPSLAIMGDEEKYVFVVEDGKAVKRNIETGLKGLSKVEIEGVEPGEKIIIGPFTTLKVLEDGTAVMDMEL